MRLIKHFLHFFISFKMLAVSLLSALMLTNFLTIFFISVFVKILYNQICTSNITIYSRCARAPSWQFYF